MHGGRQPEGVLLVRRSPSKKKTTKLESKKRKNPEWPDLHRLVNLAKRDVPFAKVKG